MATLVASFGGDIAVLRRLALLINGDSTLSDLEHIVAAFKSYFAPELLSRQRPETEERNFLKT